MTPDLSRLLSELDIAIVRCNETPGPMKSFADNTMERIFAAHGEAHMRSVLIAISQTGRNSRMLVAPVLWAVSDVLKAHPEWFGSSFLDAMDRIDLKQLYATAREGRSVVQPRQALAAMLFERLRGRFEGIAA